MQKICLRWLLALGCIQFFASPEVLGVSGTTQVAWSGKPVEGVPGWPSGVLELVNDPLRTDGWNPWFSEWPNDVNWYEFKVRDTTEINHLIKKLAAISHDKISVRLNPAKAARALAFTTVLPEKNKTAVVFCIGNQQRLDAWYQRLETSESGARKFGVSTYRHVPEATPPTLTIYVGHEAVDVDRLEIPETVNVTADLPANREAENKDAATAIEKFLVRRKQKSNSRANAAWVEQCLGDFQVIKPGMSRSEVEKKFRLDGGVQSASPVRFVHPQCAYFKVDVEFDFEHDASDKGRAVISPDDKVIRISKPYLERPFAD